MRDPFVQVKEMANGVYVLDELGRDNMWLIEGDEKCLLVDTGFGLTDLPALVKQITDKPVVVANSHIHPDHCSGNNQFPQVMCGRFDEPFAHEQVSAEMREEMLRNFPEIANAGAAGKSWRPGPSARIVALKEGDIIPLGGLDIGVYEIPSHTIGAIALLDKKHRLLFTGDTILTWEVWGQLAVSSALSVYCDSLRKIAGLAPFYDYIAPAHSSKNRPYLMEKGIAELYVKGTEEILSGKKAGTPKHTFAGDGLCVMFETGGIVYDPNRL